MYKSMEGVKCVVVGDHAIGKTSMLVSHTTGSYASEYVPTVFDNYCANVMVDARPISLGLWDTSATQDFDRLRPLSYKDTDVFVVCYSIVSPTSLENVRIKWIPEIRHHCPDAPLLLVGTKCDLRQDKRFLEKIKSSEMHALVDLARAEETGTKIAAARVMECSGKTFVGLKDVFDVAVRTALAFRDRPRKEKTKCLVL